MTVAFSIPNSHSSQDDFPQIHEYPEFTPYRKFNNFVIIPGGMIAHKDLPDSALILYGTLSKYSGQDGLCYPSQQTLANDLGISIRQVRNLVEILEKYHYIRRQRLSEHDNRRNYIFLVNQVIAGDLKDQNLSSDAEGQVFPEILSEIPSEISPDDLEATPNLSQAVETASDGQGETDFRSDRKSISAPFLILKEKKKDSPSSSSISTTCTAVKNPDFSERVVAEQDSNQTNLFLWEETFGSKLPWKMANGSYVDEIEYMIHLAKNKKLKITSSPIGYLRTIHKSIPLNWKEDLLKKKFEAQKKQADQTLRQKEEENQILREKNERELHIRALKQWESMAQKEQQTWFDLAKQQQKIKAQKGLPVFRINKPKHLWSTAKILFCGRVVNNH